MHWQDFVFSVGSWIFIVSLIPTIRGKQKPEFSTSIVTTFVLILFTISYATLGLWLAALSNTGTAAGWAILAYQRYKQPKK